MNQYESYLQALAQLETAGGKKTIKGPNGEDSFNYYNIKDNTGKGYRAFDKAEGSRDAYRVYSSPDESKADVVSLLQRRYPGALDAPTIDDFATALVKGGYATDPNYKAKLLQVHNSLQGGQPQQNQSADLSPYQQAGYGEIIAKAKAQGYSDASIKKNLDLDIQDFQNRSVAAAKGNDNVAVSLAKGGDVTQQVALLRQAGHSAEIDWAKQNGFTDEQIIKNLAPEAYSKGVAAKTNADKAGFVGNAASGAVDTLSGLGRGLQQIGAQITGNDARNKELQDEEQASRMDLDRIARGETIGGMVGRAAPYVATALIPGAGTIAGATAIGAATGALEPTVEGESRLDNALMGGAVGGGAVGAVKGVSKFYRASGDAIDAMKGYKPLDQKTIAAEITGRAGNPGEVVNSKWVADTKNLFEQKYGELYKGVTANIDDATRAEIEASVRSGSLPLEYRREIAKVLYSGKDEAGNWIPTTAVPVENVQRIARTIGKDLANPNLNAIKRERLGTVADALNGTVKKSLDDAGKGEQFAALQDQYKNFKAARNMIAPSGDTGVITADTLQGAITKGRFRQQFEEGRAPLQDMLPSVRTDVPGVPPIVQSALKVGSYVPGMQTPVRAAALALSYVMKKPVARAAFISKLSPVEQAAVQKVATSGAAATAQEAAVAEQAIAKIQPVIDQVQRSEELAQAMQARNQPPLQLGYSKPTPAPIMVDSAGRASTDEAALFAAKYAPQEAAAPQATAVIEQKAAPVVESAVEAPKTVRESIEQAMTKLEQKEQAKTTKNAKGKLTAEQIAGQNKQKLLVETSEKQASELTSSDVANDFVSKYDPKKVVRYYADKHYKENSGITAAINKHRIINEFAIYLSKSAIDRFPEVKDFRTHTALTRKLAARIINGLDDESIERIIIDVTPAVPTKKARR